MAQADLILFVSDASKPWSEQDQRWLAAHAQDTVLVHNKSDLATRQLENRPKGHPVSATRGDGLQALVALISQRLVPVDPPPMAPIPFLARHEHQLKQAVQSLDDGDIQGAQRGLHRMIHARQEQARQQLDSE